tara:strand:- start:462 stop:932 length:471 start_codon:yes stop_codon:yes gene_type:complete
MNNSDLYILTFIVTGLWDVVLRVMNEQWDKLPVVLKKILPFIKYLDVYFKKHTLLAAALIAAFVGATTQVIIINIMKFPTNLNLKYMLKFLLLSFVISALYGFIMKGSKLFPILEETYYKRLEQEGGVIRSMYHDGISGLIVQITIIVLLTIKKNL